MNDGSRSVLFIENLDIASPLGCTVPYYLTTTLASTHDVHVICRKRSARREDGSVPDGVVLHDIDTGEVPLVSGLLFVVLSTLYSMLLAAVYRYDTVYAFQHELVQGWLSARVGGSKFVAGLQSVPVRQDRDLAVHDPALQLEARLTMWFYDAYAAVFGAALARATEVVCLTDGIRDVAEEVYGVDLSDAHVIGMGVDTDTFLAASTDPGADDAGANDAGADTEPWTLTYLGALHEARGLDQVLEAIAETDHDVRLRVAGSGPDDYVASLKRTARELGVDDRVEWLGLLPHDDVPRLLQSTDVAVSPLREIESYRISFPAKLLEYMATGCVVLATDIESHRRVVDDGRNGFLYDARETGFRQALDRCLDRSDRHEAVRRAARRTAEAHDWDRIVAQHELVIVGD